MDTNTQTKVDNTISPAGQKVPSNLFLANIENITDTNFKLLKPEWLGDETLMLKLKAYIFEIVETDETFLAIECFEHLQALLTQYPKLAKNRPDILMEYLRLLAILKASFLENLSDQDIQLFYRENLLFCLEVQDFDLGRETHRLLNLYYKDPKEYEDLRRKIQDAVESNLEFLGAGTLTLDDKGSGQYMNVANWLHDYNHFSVGFSISNKAQASRNIANRLGGSLERVSYLQKSNNVRALSKDEKLILFKLLEFYDWLKTLRPGHTLYTPFFSSYIQTEEGKELGEIYSSREDDSQLARPNIPQPKNVRAARPIEEVSGLQRQQSINNVEKSSLQQPHGARAVLEPRPTAAAVQPRQAYAGANIQDILKKRAQEENMSPGLRMGGGENKSLIPNPSRLEPRPDPLFLAENKGQGKVSNTLQSGNSNQVTVNPQVENRKPEAVAKIPQAQENNTQQPLKQKFNFSMPKATESKQAEIDRKLEELGKRTGGIK